MITPIPLPEQEVEPDEFNTDSSRGSGQKVHPPPFVQLKQLCGALLFDVVGKQLDL